MSSSGPSSSDDAEGSHHSLMLPCHTSCRSSWLCKGGRMESSGSPSVGTQDMSE